MADRPILFSAPMVRALLDGRKTQTRRVIKSQPEINAAGLWVWPPREHLGGDAKAWARRYGGFCQTDDEGLADFLLSRFGRPLPAFVGDRLWVREAFTMEGQSEGECLYRATVDDDTDYYPDEIAEIRWKSPIHMPRWASRLTLTVTDVRVQRLQDISEADAMDEGAKPILVPPDGGSCPHVEGYRDIWNSLHGPDAWDANPWVCALTFTVQRGNIDQIGSGNG